MLLILLLFYLFCVLKVFLIAFPVSHDDVHVCGRTQSLLSYNVIVGYNQYGTSNLPLVAMYVWRITLKIISYG